MKNLMLLLLVSFSSLAKDIHLQSSERQTQVIELFSSEGCSSCPPADRWLSSLKNNKGLFKQFIPLAMHVDYWDYIGWKDKFASKDNTTRQQIHQMFGNLRSVYTPGVLTAGKEWRAWRFATINQSPLKVGKLSLDLKGEQLNASFASTKQGKYNLKVALLAMDLSSTIRAGENKGKQLKHDFVLLKQKSFASDNGKWDDLLSHDFFYTPHKNLVFVAWVESDENPAPIQAVGSYL